ncbi:hypothetical protein PT974_02342 [Cladobotryum mycophilum]|uniref:Peptidase M50B-like-domain-containing protein n=1 Tax=Cladobotryum mycophilum TaxID=491253 RepID=A0ABR0SXY6_9HYPO
MAPSQIIEAAFSIRIVAEPTTALHYHALTSRNLQHPTHTQQVTLGVIAAYVVAIAILWNVPYLRMILWPFKREKDYPSDNGTGHLYSGKHSPLSLFIPFIIRHFSTLTIPPSLLISITLATLIDNPSPMLPSTLTHSPQMLVIAFHEFGHAITAILTGGRVKSISLDPNEGGVTHLSGGISAITLPAGYLGSSLIGALLTFCGFNIVASKIASIVLGVCFLLTLWWGKRNWLTVLTILLAVGLLIGCWFIAHAEALRFVVLFIGVMSSLYSVWDICDDLILRKVNSSDASVFAERYGGSSQCWGVIWSIISVLIMAVGIIAGLAAFSQSFAQQQEDSKHFIPT